MLKKKEKKTYIHLAFQTVARCNNGSVCEQRKLVKEEKERRKKHDTSPAPECPGLVFMNHDGVGNMVAACRP